MLVCHSQSLSPWRQCHCDLLLIVIAIFHMERKRGLLKILVIFNLMHQKNFMHLGQFPQKWYLLHLNREELFRFLWPVWPWNALSPHGRAGMSLLGWTRWNRSRNQLMPPSNSLTVSVLFSVQHYWMLISDWFISINSTILILDLAIRIICIIVIVLICSYMLYAMVTAHSQWLDVYLTLYEVLSVSAL